ncbi:hypothetical protein Esi_0029_0030 [Ectocarpus siliculosus]|uniref:Uncharacterized protein n=1 Tax=Ectocarpus siliculosus TaxID=2880 RepID=D7FV88_ECTSI|nr:hypothetical protein Esi_0029_0030 [Ectocarpus siliculosus]|eukprot:CBJ26260.1 hypothetical protein Esi_0029_0030 [Ectocarpus siliculosus]
MLNSQAGDKGDGDVPTPKRSRGKGKARVANDQPGKWARTTPPSPGFDVAQAPLEPHQTVVFERMTAAMDDPTVAINRAKMLEIAREVAKTKGMGEDASICDVLRKACGEYGLRRSLALDQLRKRPLADNEMKEGGIEVFDQKKDYGGQVNGRVANDGPAWNIPAGLVLAGAEAIDTVTSETYVWRTGDPHRSSRELHEAILALVFLGGLVWSKESAGLNQKVGGTFTDEQRERGGAARGSRKGRSDHERGGAGVRRDITLARDILRSRPESTDIPPFESFKCPEEGCGNFLKLGDRWFFDILQNKWKYVGPRCQPKGGHSAAEMVPCSDAKGKEGYSNEEMKMLPFVGNSRASKVVRENQDAYAGWLTEDAARLEEERR